MTLDSVQFSPATAVWNWRHALSEVCDRLNTLYEAVDNPESLSPPQWGHLYSAVLEFQPDLIVELGRHFGNSTCVFTEAANQIKNCRVVSLCRSTYWQDRTVERVRAIVPANWFDPLDVKVTDILQTDIEAILGDSQRVMFLWDAHSYNIAEFMLGRVMPLLKERKHLVIMHDISDLRYNAGLDYNGKRLWRSGSDDVETDHGTRVVIGHLSSAVEQVISIVDFTSRNHLTLHSADQSFHTELTEEQTSELHKSVGQFFSQNGHWFWFSLNDKPPEETVYFPAFMPSEMGKSISLPPNPQINLELDHARARIQALEALVEGMESSKFWRLRTAWFKLKQILGLPSQL